MALTKVSTPAIKDEAITLAKLLHGDSNSNGKFLRANNGADPTFETVNTDLVSDTSPQLGGDLDTNSHHILLDDDHNLKFGNDTDLEIFHQSSNDINLINSHKLLKLMSNGNTELRTNNNDLMIKAQKQGAVELYHNNIKRLETDSNGVTVTAPEGEQAILKLIGDEGDDANDSFRLNAGGGSLRIQDASNQSSWEDNIVINAAGSVELYHDNSKKFETYSAGSLFTGNLKNTNDGANQAIYLGQGDDLGLYHDGTNSVISNQTGHLMTMLPANKGFRIQKVGGQEDIINAYADGNVELFHDGTKRFSTSSQGFNLKEGNTTRMSFTYSGGLNFITANAGNEIKVSSGNGDSNGIEFWDYTGVNKRCQIDGHGIKFNADTAEANALNDYEEGTWTPQMHDGNGSNVVLSLTSGDNFYTKIGRVVFINGIITRNETGSKSGDLMLTNLPFAGNVVSQLATGSWWMDRGFGNDTVGGVCYKIGSNTTTMRFVNPTAVHTNAGGDDAAKSATRYLQFGQWQQQKHIYFNLTYMTA